MTVSNVLVTGMSGLIGGAVQRHLRDRYVLSALNRSPVPGIRTFQADIADLEAIMPAFVGQAVVVHLAASKGGDWPEVLHTNIVGTYNVFEASRRAGVQRVIFASSGATISGWQREEPYKAIMEGRYADVPPTWPLLTHETPVRPWSLYGSTKVWGEAVARHFTETTELSIICLRIAVVVPEDRPTSHSITPVWCSQRDVAQMIERCIAAPADLKFDIFNVVSNNRWGFRDISHARQVVGYAPQDSAEDVWNAEQATALAGSVRTLIISMEHSMTPQPSPPLVVYVDVDDTLVRTVGTKRIPIPAAIAHVRMLKEQGASLYCWSSGGAAYAQLSAEEVGVADCFGAFLPKPHVLIDDQHVVDWRRLVHMHPNMCGSHTVEHIRKLCKTLVRPQIHESIVCAAGAAAERVRYAASQTRRRAWNCCLLMNMTCGLWKACRGSPSLRAPPTSTA